MTTVDPRTHAALLRKSLAESLRKLARFERAVKMQPGRHRKTAITKAVNAMVKDH